MSAELLWPHQHPTELLAASAGYHLALPDQIFGFALGGLTAKFGELRGVRGPGPYKWGAESCYEVFNGHKKGVELVDKRRFPAMIRALGYRTPATLTVLPGDDPKTTIAAIAALDIGEPRRFLKPVASSRGKGGMRATDPTQAMQFAQLERRPYLVQTLEPASHEWRYVMHRDPRQVEAGAPPSWRIAYRKQRPRVIGDGRQPLGRLVADGADVPTLAKIKYRLHSGRDRDRVPTSGEQLDLAAGGTVGSELPSRAELETLDRFFGTLLLRLEHRIGARLATICFDIGVTCGGALTEPYDEQRLRHEIVFYEYQVPFSCGGYLMAAARTQDADTDLSSQPVTRVRSVCHMAKTMLVFEISMLASGTAARTRRSLR